MNSLQRNLFWKFALPTVVLFGLCVIGMAFFVPILLKQSAIDSAVANGKETGNQFKTLRSYYTQNVAKKLVDRGDIKLSATHETDNALPLPATVILDMSDLLQNEGTTLELYSPFPFPGRRGRALDEFSREAWAYLQKNPDGVYTKAVEVNGKDIVRVAMPDKMASQSCVNCHNTRPDSAKRDWQLGELGGVLEVDSNIDDVLASGMRTSRWVMLGVVGLAIAVMGFGYFSFKKHISMPLSDPGEGAKSLRDGELAVSTNEVSQDEAGQIQVALRKDGQTTSGQAD